MPFEIPKPKTTAWTPPLSEDEKAISSLTSQYENLKTRLESVGVQPDKRAFNLTEGQGLLGDFLELWDRPARGAVAGFQALADTDKTTTFWENFKQGISGELDVTGGQLLETVGWINDYENLAGWKKFIADVGVDMVLDPLNLIPAGTFGKLLGSANRKLGKLIIGGEDGVQSLIKAGKIGDATKVRAIQKSFDVSEEFTQTVAKYTDELGDSVKAVEKATEEFRLAKKILPENDDFFKFVKMPTDKSKGILREDYMRDLVKQVEDGSVKYSVLTEYEAFDKLARAFESLDPNIKVIMNQTSDRLDDVAVYYKVAGPDGAKYMRLYDIEAKNFMSKASGSAQGAAAFTAIMDFVEEGDKVIATFAKGSTISEESATLLKKAFGYSIKEGETLDEAIGKAIKTFRETGVKKGVSVKKLEVEANKQLKDLFVQVMKDKGMDKMYVTGARGVGKNTERVGKFVTLDDLLKEADITAGLKFTTGAYGKVIQPRLSIDLKLLKGNIDNLTDIQDKLVEETIAQVKKATQLGDFIPEKLASQAKDINIGVLTALSLKEGRLQTPAQAMLKTLDGIKGAFNLTHNLSPEFVENYKRIQGESANILQENSRKLAAVSEDIVKIDADGLRYTQEIIEKGAHLGDESRFIQASDLLAHYKDSAIAGKGIFLPANKLQADNVLYKLNEAVRNSLGVKGDAFELVKGETSIMMRLKDDVLTLDELNKLPIESIALELDLGKAVLSKEAEAFLKKAGALENVTKLDNLQNSLIQRLSDELGVENIDDALLGTTGYARHVISKEGRALQKEGRALVNSKYARQGVDMLADRKFLGTADEVNAGMKEFFGMTDDVFDVNIQSSVDSLIHYTATRIEESKMLETILTGQDKLGRSLFKVIDNTKKAGENLGPGFKFVAKMEEDFSNIMKNLSPNARKVLEDNLFENGFEAGTKAIAIQNKAFELLKRVDNAFVEVPEFIKGYDKFMNAWKSVTLVSPGFHMRNLFGNSMNSYVAGMSMTAQANYGRKAMLELNQYKGILEKIARNGDSALTKSERQIYDTVVDYLQSGVSQTHKGIRDLESVRKMLEEGGKTGASGALDKLVKLNFDFAEAMDDVQRYMMYRWAKDGAQSKAIKALGQGATADQLNQWARNYARKKTAESLFDYGHLTQFERDYMKRLFPFYTFMKNNLIFQAKNIWQNPKQYARLGRAYNYGIEDMSGFTEDQLPEYATQNMWLPLPINFGSGDTEMITFLKANLPLSDFIELVENPLKKGATSLTAPLKMALELGANTDFFTGSPIKEFSGEQARMTDDGILQAYRGEQGEFAFAGDPVIQKIANDLGLRVPKNYLGLALDIADGIAGYKTAGETTASVLNRLSVAGTKEATTTQISNIYSDIARLRELQDLYEQQTGSKLPTLAELGK